MEQRFLVAFVTLLACVGAASGQIGLPNGFQAELWLDWSAGYGLSGIQVGPGGAWGDDLYALSSTTLSLVRVTAPGQVEIVATGFSTGYGALVFDTTSSFSGDMFISDPHNQGGYVADPIHRISPDGTRSIFYASSTYDLLMRGIAFGGDGRLYVMDEERNCLQAFTNNASRSAFGSGITSWDYADDMRRSPGGAWGDGFYMTDAFNDRVLHMSDAGATTIFSQSPVDVSLAFGEGVFGDKLYVSDRGGVIYAFQADGTRETFATGLSGPEDRIRGLVIAGDYMWVAMDGAGLYRIMVPEPATVGLMVIGAAGLLRRRGR